MLGGFAMSCALPGPLAAQPATAGVTDVNGRWSLARINAWHDKQPWLVGANYVPRHAINQLEMWQADTFNPAQIDEELGWAASIGMNTMRVFLHDLAWAQDPQGFIDRMDRFLAICAKHQIKPMFVFFDDVWNPDPNAGRQPVPRPHVHNSGWVQSPGRAILSDPARQDSLKPYVEAVLRRFGNDDRILAWDLYNEPGNMVIESYGARGTNTELPDKPRLTLMLLKKVFRWARDVNPSQPLSAGIYWNAGGKGAAIIDPVTLKGRPFARLHPINQFALANSDVINWHSYGHAASFAAEIREMGKWGRPLMLTEYLARDNKVADGTNRFQTMLPIAKGFGVAMFNWGLVDGKSQTKYPWSSWNVTMTKPPAVWHHDIFNADGSAHDPQETAFIARITGKAKTSAQEN